MKLILKVIALFVFLSSCKHDFERPTWNADFSTPLAFTQLDLLKLANDSTIQFDTLGDNSLKFVFLKELIDYRLDSLISLEEISTTKNVKLQTINFSNTVVTNKITLGQLISSIDFGTLLFPNGGNAVIPAYSDLLNDTFPIDANEYFEEMVFTEGYIDLKITNDLPTDLSNVVLELRNKNTTNSIISMTIPLLESGTTEMTTESLAGQTLFGDLEVEILNADIVGTSPNSVTINYADALVSEVKIRDIELYEGTAIFPTQQIFDEDTVVSFQLDDVKLNKVLVREGGVDVIGVSTIQDTIKIEYKIPGATLNGQAFEFYFNLPPAPIGESITVTKFFDFSGYEIDMTGKYGDTVNTIYTQSTGFIDSSGIITNISLEDSVFNTITIKEMIPEKAWGTLGTDTFTETQTIDFSDFSDFQGEIDISQIDVILSTENYIGANADVWIKNLSGKNNQEAVTTLASPLLSTPFSIASAIETNSENQPITPSNTNITFNESNSNIDELIESKPEIIDFSFEFVTNPNLNNSSGFLYSDYGLKSNLEIGIPLSINATDIVIKDTLDISINNVEELNEGTFTLLAKNRFPLEAEVIIRLLNGNGTVLESLDSDQTVQSSETDINGKSIEATTSELTFYFESISQSLTAAEKIAFEVRLNSRTDEQFVTLYSDYYIDLKLIANFNYTID